MIERANLLELRMALDLGRLHLDEHRERIEELRARFQHTIRYVEDSDDTCNCAAYTLGLWDDPVYRDVKEMLDRSIFANGKFIRWLIARELQSIQAQEIGCLVIYFNDDKFKHIGQATQIDRVISKWGQFPIYEHEPLEVPAEYGNALRFYKMISPDQARARFQQYAADRLRTIPTPLDRVLRKGG